MAWLLVGYTVAFSEDAGGGLIGNLEHFGMLGIDPTTVRGSVPELLFATFQLSFAIVTAALVSGAIADRAKFAAWMVFVPLWTVAVYAVVAHWVWGPGGWLFELGVLDYAGGLVVEIVSGASALALALVLGPRIGFKKDAMRPHNLPFVLLGAGLLWFGWFGFNAGSALAANGTGRGGLPEHAGRRVPRHDGLDHGRADPRRQADDIRCRVRRGRRPRRDHAVLRHREHPRRASSWAWRRGSSARSRSG